MSLTARFEVRKRIPLDGASDFSRGFTTIPDGYVECDFSIEVDRDRLIGAVGAKAERSARKVTKLQGGSVVVKHLGGSRFSVLLDEGRLIRMIGNRAAFSVKGTSKLQGGAVVVRVIDKRRIPPKG